MREVVVEVVDVLKNAKKQKASPNGVNRSVRKRAKFAHYRTCTCPILYSLVSNPALPPESLGQIGFGAVYPLGAYASDMCEFRSLAYLIGLEPVQFCTV